VELDALETELLVDLQLLVEGEGLAHGRAEGVRALVDVPGPKEKR
jgi:hypothetical protein